MKKIIKALVLALCVALAVCAFAVVSSAEEPVQCSVEGCKAHVTIGEHTEHMYGTTGEAFVEAWNYAHNERGTGDAVMTLFADAMTGGQMNVNYSDNRNYRELVIDLNGYKLTTHPNGLYNSNGFVTTNAAFYFRDEMTRLVFKDNSPEKTGTIIVGNALAIFGEGSSSLDYPMTLELDGVKVQTTSDAALLYAFKSAAKLVIKNSIIDCTSFIGVDAAVKDCQAPGFFVDAENTTVNASSIMNLNLDPGTAYHNWGKPAVFNFTGCTFNSTSDTPMFTMRGIKESDAFAYIPSYHMFTDLTLEAQKGMTQKELKQKKNAYVVPTPGQCPELNLNNCTVNTTADSVFAPSSDGYLFPMTININGGTYKINTDGTADGEKFISRVNSTQQWHKVTLGKYEGVAPSFNFNPADVTSTTFGGVYTACCKETSGSTSKGTYKIERNAGIYNVVEDNGMYTLVDRVYAPAGLLYNLTLSDKLSINLATPSTARVGRVADINDTTIKSNGDLQFTTNDVVHKVFQIKNINIVSMTDTYTFVVTEKDTNLTHTVEVSILGYAKAVLAGNYTETEQELARALLDYALEAEKLAAEVDTEAVAELTTALGDKQASKDATEFAGAKLDPKLAETALYGAAIDFSGDAPALILALDEALAEDFTITVSYIGNRKAVNTKDYTFVAGTTQITLDAMSAFDFGNDITITVNGAEYVFNLAALLNKLVEADANYTGFANALYNYVNAAKAYQAVAPQY